ncbi:MAG: hypothetical protein H8E31_06505 [Planctomycetes bacterium]|nr:hypothetical protein [Planctomycetota bacterium]
MAAAWLLLLGILAQDPAGAALRTPGFEDGEVLPYDLLVLPGEGAAGEELELVLRGESGFFPVREGRFKALAELEPGVNELLLRSGGEERRLRLVCRPLRQERAVRFVYALAADGEGRFDAPPGEPNGVESARRRIALGARLMQSFTAEKLCQAGHGRRTFRVLAGPDGAPAVEVVRSSKSAAELAGMDGYALWDHFYAELEGLAERESTIDVVLMAFSHWDAEAESYTGHTALGGGRLALFGSAQLHSWAESLAQVPARFGDARPVPAEHVRDDSCFRGSFWANYATTLGATLHELGHCFGLPHQDEGVMARGFDLFNRSFVVEEPVDGGGRGGIRSITLDQETRWHPASAAILAENPWLAEAGAEEE